MTINHTAKVMRARVTTTGTNTAATLSASFWMGALEALASRTLKRYGIPPSKLILELGYSIDYEDEKETFDIDGEGNVKLIDGRVVPWEAVKRDGFDYIALSFIDKEGKQRQFLDAELA